MEADSRRLRWQCRRGMRELDVLLTRYLDAHYDGADQSHRDAFRALLTLSDPELAAYLLLGESPADEDTKHVVQRILLPVDS